MGTAMQRRGDIAITETIETLYSPKPKKILLSSKGYGK
jgi:hypothetical protein